MSRSSLLVLVSLALPALAADKPSPWAEIRIVDDKTGRGVPLVELETVNRLRFVTDNAGRVAFLEPGLLGRTVYFSVRSHGYEMKKDGFGFAGARLVPQAGEVREIRLTRKNLAERLCRLTGEGLYRDSVLLGHPVPLKDPLNPGRIAGQDSVQAVPYRGRIYWLWGDSSRMEYPLGLFRMAGATTPLLEGVDPAGGIAYDYFVDKQSQFARAMMPLPERPQGVVWISALFTVPDEKGKQTLVGHYSRRKGLADELEQGIAIFNDDKMIFEVARSLPLTETWRKPSGHPIVHEEGGTKWLLFGSPTPHVRVPATLRDVLNPERYEAWTCVRAGESANSAKLDVDEQNQPRWRWQRQLPPVTSAMENGWIQSGKLSAEHARFCPQDARGGEGRVVLHNGSVRWNAHRQRWILLACQVGGKSSFLGEVWYAEALHPTGPFAKTIKVVTHDRMSFYNVCQHAFLDREGGKLIHFEGTYTHTFSGNPDQTPRYDYNQILYRLNLDTAELKPAQLR